MRVSNISGRGGAVVEAPEAAEDPLALKLEESGADEVNWQKRRRRCVNNSRLNAFHCCALIASLEEVSGWIRRDLYSVRFCPCMMIGKVWGRRRRWIGTCFLVRVVVTSRRSVSELVQGSVRKN